MCDASELNFGLACQGPAHVLEFQVLSTPHPYISGTLSFVFWPERRPRLSSLYALSARPPVRPSARPPVRPSARPPVRPSALTSGIHYPLPFGLSAGYPANHPRSHFIYNIISGYVSSHGCRQSSLRFCLCWVHQSKLCPNGAPKQWLAWIQGKTIEVWILNLESNNLPPPFQSK